jgi:hypothetical protein
MKMAMLVALLGLTLSQACAQISTPKPAGADVAPTTTGVTSWVYHNGSFKWPGDWSWAAVPNYKDTSGVPLSGKYDIAVRLVGQWGGWQPYALGQNFSLKPYKYMTISIKTTVTPQPIHIFFQAANDTPVGTWVDPVAGGFGPAAVVGQWQTYKIPLAALGVSGLNILKFGVQDDSGGAANTFYLDDVGFTN